ncbi:autotransporter beta-domain protein [Rickettsia hoogstraalii str. RCCE3]|nr:autotransporter beta-domain protein [Rickettsia hoogstraalii str. RCCE3]
MNKLTEQNLLKKSRFLKYSLLTSISVGAVMAMPVEGMAMNKEAFRTELSKKLSLNKDTTNTPQQIGTVIVPEPERNTYTSSEIREMEISKQSKAFNPLKDVPIEDHYKVVAHSKYNVGKARKARPITRRKAFVGAEKVEQNQNNYTPEPTEQTPQKPEIIITASSPTVSPASNGFVTAPNTPNTTLISPEHYTTAPGTPSSTPATPYQPTLDSKPNDNLGAKTPPNTNSKAVRRLSFSSEPQQTVQPSTQAKPPVPPKPLLLSSAEVAAKMVSNILRVNETLGIKLAEVESTIKNTQGKKNKKPLQQLQKQIVSSQKKIKALKLEAAEIGIKIKALDEENRSLASCNKKTGGVKNKRELDKDSAKVKENNKKIDELQQKLTNKNEEANSLSREIDVSVGGIVLTKPQGKAPVTEMPPAGAFLNQQQQLEVLTQQQKVNAARQAVIDKRRAEANKVRRNSAEYKDLISEREGVQLEQNQRHIAVEKTKKQQQAEDKQRTEREKKRKKENHQKEKAKDIVGIREDIAKKMQQISNANTTSNRLQELELKVGAIEDKKQRREAQKQLSKIKKQEKAIKAAADEAQKILNDAKKEAGRTKLKKLQEQMGNHVAMVTNDKIEESIKKLEGLVLTPSTTSSTATISKQSLTAKSTMPLSHELQRTLPEDEDGYLEPIKAQQQPYTVMLSNQEVADPKSINSGLGSLPIGASVIPQYVEELNNLASFPSLNQIQQEKSQIITNKLLSETSALSDDEFRAVANKVHPKIRPILTYNSNRQKEKEAKLVEAETAHNQAVQNAIKTPNSTQAKEAVENAAKLFGQHNNNFKLTQDLRDEHRKKYYETPKKVTDSINSLDLAVLAESQQLKEPRSKSLEALDLAGSVSSQLKQAEYKSVLSPSSSVNSLLSNEDEQNHEFEIPKLSLSFSFGSLSSDAESNLSRSPSINGLEDLSGSNIMKLERTLEEKKFYINKNLELFWELWREDNYDPFLTDLGNQIFKGEQEIQKLEEEKKILEDKVTPNSLKDKPLRRSSSASSLNIFGSNEDLSWDNTGDIGVGHRYGAEDSCPTPDHSSSKIANSSDKNSSETKLALLQAYQMAVIVKRQELEQLPSTSSGAAQIVQQIEVLREEEVTMHDTINACIADSSKLNDVSFEEINEALKKLGSEIPESAISDFESKAQKDPKAISDGSILQEMLSSKDSLIPESAISDFESKAQKDPEAISDGSILQEMLSSKDSLPSGDEEQEDTEVTESGIQKAGDKGLLALPVSSNECALALSDSREKECLTLGDGSEDEESYDSGFEEEEEIIEQLSDSDGGNLKITEVDTAIPLEQKAKKEMQTQISENAPTLNQAKVVNTIVNNMIRNRLDASMNMSNNMVAVGAGDEEESRIKRGLWMRGMYGTNNHGRVENMTGYRGTNKGATIGFDVEIDNNILGIAYSNVHSVFKFKNSKNNDKELIDSHVVSIYGQKELPRNFALQALVSASKNFIKDKTTYSYGDTKIRSNVKHRNHSYNAEALLNYNYLLQNKLVITPNIGLRYGKSRDGIYNETGINVQEIALTMKENNILSGIVGTKVKVPLKDVLKFNNLGLTFQGAVEHNFKEKTQRINRVVKIFDNTFKQDYLIPKQPKTSYNLGTGIIGSIKNTTISLDYNYYLNKHYRSHQGSVKLKVNL